MSRFAGCSFVTRSAGESRTGSCERTDKAAYLYAAGACFGCIIMCESCHLAPDRGDPAIAMGSLKILD
jgi:hypothetical protein